MHRNNVTGRQYTMQPSSSTGQKNTAATDVTHTKRKDKVYRVKQLRIKYEQAIYKKLN